MDDRNRTSEEGASTDEDGRKDRPRAGAAGTSDSQRGGEGTDDAFSPASRSRALAETIVGSFIERLTAEAVRKGGTLTVADIEALNGEFAAQTEALQVVVEKSLEEYVRVRVRSVWDQARQYPFDRLIVEKFAHLFAGEGELTLKTGALSRRILPGFFLAMNLMLGADLIEEYQERCRSIVARLRDEKGDGFGWDDAHHDAEASRVALDAVVAVASYFENLEKRTDWFLDLINSHLGSPDAAREGPDAATWQFTEEAFHRFLGALFTHVRESMSTESGRLAITKSHGAEACAALWTILKNLEAVGAGG